MSDNFSINVVEILTNTHLPVNGLLQFRVCSMMERKKKLRVMCFLH